MSINQMSLNDRLKQIDSDCKSLKQIRSIWGWTIDVPAQHFSDILKKIENFPNFLMLQICF